MIEIYSVLIMDLFCVLVSYACSVYIRFHIIHAERYPRDFHITVGAYIIVLCLLYSLFLDANSNFFYRGWLRELYYTVRYTLILVVGLVVVLYLTQQAYSFSRLIYGIFLVLNILITYAAHMAFKKAMWKYYRKSESSTKMLVVTLDITADEVIDSLMKGKEWYYDITAAAVYDADRVGSSIQSVPVVASKERLYEVVVQMLVDEVFICLPGVPTLEIRDMIQRFEEMGLVCHYNVDIFSRSNPNTYVQKMAGYSVISFALKTMDSRRLLVKFFSQTRVGKNGRRFQIWKFRSMYIDAEERKKELEEKNEVKGLMFKMEDDPRITRVGKFIRKTSIDETPQFLNILVGDMSLVGTRPPTEDEFEQYNGYYRRRMSITPGLTGMWQVSGRSDIRDFEEIVKLDLEYIDNWSLGLDIKILFMTVFAVLGRKGSK